MKQLVDWFVKAMDSTELSFVTLLSKIVPLFVPVIPAYVGYRHVTNPQLLNFDPFFGWVYALVIEGLGYAAIYKAVAFWEHNKKYTEGSPNRAPLKVAIGIYIVYLVVTLAVNVVLDWVSGVVWYNVLAIGLISILSVPAGLLMSISAIHTERENERSVKSQQRKTEQQTNTPANEQRTPRRTNGQRTNTPIPQPTNQQTNEQDSERTLGFPQNERRESILSFIEQVKANENRTPGPSEISRELGVSKGYASDVMNGKA